MAQIDTLALLLGITGDTGKIALAQFELDKTCDMVINYCNLDEVPTALNNIVLSMAMDMYRVDNLGSETAAVGAVKSITEGDTSVSFGNAASISENPAMEFLKGYTAQLDRFRKLGW